MQIIATIRRLRRAKPTSQSITEQHSALDDDAVAGLDAAPENGLVALLETDVDGARLERPWRDLDQHLTGVVLQHQRAGRDDRHALRRRIEADIGEHAGLETRGGIVESDTDLGASRVGVEDVADEQNLPLED